MLRSVVAIMEPHATAAGVKLKAELDADLPVTVTHGTKVRLLLPTH
jgi:hypothetical protein